MGVPLLQIYTFYTKWDGFWLLWLQYMASSVTKGQAIEKQKSEFFAQFFKQ